MEGMTIVNMYRVYQYSIKRKILLNSCIKSMLIRPEEVTDVTLQCEHSNQDTSQCCIRRISPHPQMPGEQDLMACGDASQDCECVTGLVLWGMYWYGQCPQSHWDPNQSSAS